MKLITIILLVLALTNSALAGVKDYLGVFKNAATVNKSYEFVCKTKIDNNTSTKFNSLYSDMCNVVKKSDLCKKIEKNDKLKCEKPEENNLDVMSFSFIKNCASGLWKSTKELIEFFYKAIVGIGKYLFKTETRDNVNKLIGEHSKSLINYVAIEFAKEKDKGKNSADAAMEIAGDLTKVLFQKISDAIQESYVELGCYNQEARQNRVCKLIGDFTMPPTIALGLIFKGGAALKIAKDVSKSDIILSKTIKVADPATAKMLAKSKDIINRSKRPSYTNSKTLDESSEKAYQAYNKKLVERYPQYASVLQDPQAYLKKIEDLFEEQKKITPENPYQFDFSEFGIPTLKTMAVDIDKKIIEIQKKLANTKTESKIKEYNDNLENLRLLKSEIAKDLEKGKVSYEDLFVTSHFFTRSIGQFDTDSIGLIDNAFLRLDRRFQGYKPLGATKELEIYKEKDFRLFQKESTVDGFQDAQKMFDEASFNKEKLKMVFIPTTEHLDADIFSRLVPYDIYFMGITPENMAADGFVRPGGDFWVHDLRHSSAIFHKRTIYEQKYNLNKEQISKLQKRSDLWREQLNKEIMEIPDKETRSAARLFMFNFHHDRGFPIVPSSYAKFEKPDSVPYWLYFMLRVSGQPVSFKNAHKKFPAAYKWLKDFWKKREAEELAIIEDKSAKEAAKPPTDAAIGHIAVPFHEQLP